jgi:hypothetical protein
MKLTRPRYTVLSKVREAGAQGYIPRSGVEDRILMELVRLGLACWVDRECCFAAITDAGAAAIGLPRSITGR